MNMWKIRSQKNLNTGPKTLHEYRVYKILFWCFTFRFTPFADFALPLLYTTIQEAEDFKLKAKEIWFFKWFLYSPHSDQQAHAN